MQDDEQTKRSSRRGEAHVISVLPIPGGGIEVGTPRLFPHYKFSRELTKLKSPPLSFLVPFTASSEQTRLFPALNIATENAYRDPIRG